MKKYAIAGCLAVFSLFLPSRCPASSTITPMFTYQAAVSSITTTIVSVSTSAGGVGGGATQMDNPQLYSRVGLEIQNIDAAANLWCLPVSTMPVASGGRKIAAGNSWVVSTVDQFYQPILSTTTNQYVPTPIAVKFWCLSDGSAATKAAVTQLY